MRSISYSTKSLDEHAPVRIIKLRGRPNPFITDEIRQLMKVRDFWRKLARRTGDPNAWTEYKNLKREVKREIRLAEREYVADQVKSNANNSSCLWKTIRSCIRKKSASERSYSRDDRAVANAFNRFFTSIGRETVDKINSLASQCNYNHSKLVFVPRKHPEANRLWNAPKSQVLSGQCH